MSDVALAAFERTGRVVVRTRRGGMALALLGALVFTAVSALLMVPWLSDPSWRAAPALVVGAAGIGFFGAVGVPTLIWRWATAARSLTITTEDVAFASGHRMRWSSVRSARLATIAGQRFVVLLPRRDPAALADLSLPGRWLAWSNGRLLHESAAVALPTQLEIGPGALLRIVQRARRLGGQL